ncbi:hypothetical protein [Cellulomonas endophytica]|uniref:hypothetical protein n=1 Tax=Cellulomonas endophytica TaxID=2494735 RepID=UPI001011E618|nr:hypothetical protein [Cellulomonas endophytica]
MSTTVLGGPRAAAAPVPRPARSRVLTVVRVQAMDAVNVLLLPWLVLASAFAVNLAIWLLVDAPDARATGGLASLYGYGMAMVAVVVSRGFPYLLGLGVTRRAVVLGTGLLLLAHAAACALVLTALWWAEDVTDGWGLQARFFRVVWLTDVAAWQLPVVYLLPFVFTSGIMGLYAAVYLRWRAVGAWVLSVAIAAALVVGVAVLARTDGWGAFGSWVLGLGPVGSTAVLAAAGLVCGVGAWLVLRRAPA